MPVQSAYIAYRFPLTNRVARRLFHELQSRGHDMYMTASPPDSENMTPLEHVQIAARGHFIVLFTPGSIERYRNNRIDHLKEEIETALNLRRNIIPVALYGFRSKDFEDFFHGRLAELVGHSVIRQKDVDITALVDDIEKQLEKRGAFGALRSVAEHENLETRQMLQKIEKLRVPADDMIAHEKIFEEATLLYHNRQHEAAMEVLNSLLKTEPGYLDAYKLRSILHHLMGELDEAIADYTMIIHLEPDSARFYNNRGIAHATLHQMSLALQDYDQAVSMAPRRADYWNNRGFARYRVGDHDGAIEDATRAIELDSLNYHAMDTRAQAYFAIGQYGRALADFRRAYGLAPTEADALAGVALCHSALNRNEEALRIWRQVIEREPRFEDEEFLAEVRHWQPRLISEMQTILRLIKQES